MKTYNTKTIYLSILFSILLSASSALAHFGSKGPYGGSISCITVYDTTVYVGTMEGGIYESTTSKLVNWRARPVGLKSGKITAITYTGKSLFTATADSGVYIFNGYVGSNRYWNKVNNGLTNLKVTSLVAINETTLMAGTNGGGVFITTNEGANWTAVNANLNHFNITALVKVGNRIFQGSNGGVFYTSNNGVSWADFNDENTSDIETKAMSYNESTDELLLFNSNVLLKVGNASTATAASYSYGNVNLPTSVVVRSISNDGDKWYLATDKGTYLSSSTSITWVNINTGLATDDVHAIDIVKGLLVCGTKDKGMFKATTPFISWTVANTNFNNVETYSMVAGGEKLVVAATSDGVFVSKDLAASYKRANQGLKDSLNVNDLELADSYLLAATKNEGIFISSDSGKTWTAINTGLSNSNIKKVFYYNGVKYAISSEEIVYSSPLNSSEWTSIQAGLPAGVIPTSMAFYDSQIVLGTYGDGIFVKPVSSGSWTPQNVGLTNPQVTSVAMLRDKIYAGTNGSGVYISDKSSIQWQTASSTTISHATMIGLDASKIQAMASYYGYMFASYKGGLVASSDNGTTWVAGGNQFNLPSFTDVNKISFVTTRVFVTTESNGLYSNALSELPVITSLIAGAESSNNALLGLSPNPTTGAFKMDYSRLNSQVKDVNVFDFSGKLMDTFSPEEQFSVNYPQGLYYVQVRTMNNELLTKKMVIE